MDAVLNNPTAAALLPPLEKDQQWATKALIQSQGLTDDKEEDWIAIKAITDACNHLLTSNFTTPTASLVVVSAMANNQSVLKMDSTPKETALVKKSPQWLPVILQLETC